MCLVSSNMVSMTAFHIVLLGYLRHDNVGRSQDLICHLGDCPG